MLCMSLHDIKEALNSKISTGELAGIVSGEITAKTVENMVEVITKEVSEIVAEISIKKGMEIEKKINAINLANAGVDLQILSSALGLSVEEIKALQQQPRI